jgi:hypothetical protein
VVYANISISTEAITFAVAESDDASIIVAKVESLRVRQQLVGDHLISFAGSGSTTTTTTAAPVVGDGDTAADAPDWQRIDLPVDGNLADLGLAALAALRNSGQAFGDLALSSPGMGLLGYLSHWVPLRAEAGSSIAAARVGLRAALDRAEQIAGFPLDLMTRGVWQPVAELAQERFSEMFSVGIPSTLSHCYRCMRQFLQKLQTICGASFAAGIAAGNSHRNFTHYAADLPRQCQLTTKFVALQAFLGQLARGDNNTQRNWQVKTSTLFR